MLDEKVVNLEGLEYDTLMDIYIETFSSGIPFKWVNWKSKAKTEKEFIIYCLNKGKPWHELIKPIEEGVKMKYTKGKENAER